MQLNPESSDVSDDPAPISKRMPRDSLSKVLWGIDWSEHFPLDVGDGIVAHASTYERSLPFVREHYAAIFEEDGTSPFSTTRLSVQKERYYRFAGDFFEFKEGDKTIGLGVCTPVDWSTYYFRSAAMLPEHRRKGVMLALGSQIFVHLKAAGVERVEADASPDNLASLAILGRMSFRVTGTTLTDRWGAHVHLTRFLDDGCADVFQNQFCAGIRHQRRRPSAATP